MPNLNTDPLEMQPPRDGDGSTGNAVWKRGLWMLVFVVLFELAKTVLLVVALVQFFWMLFAREKNAGLAGFGRELGNWLRDVSLFQSGASEAKPFPWGKWG